MNAHDPRAALSAVTRDLYRQGMARLPAAVNIITSVSDGERYGFTASAVCSVTDSPPTLLVCVNRANQSHKAIASSRVLCVNTLAGPHHEGLSMAFAGGVQTMDERFAGAHWIEMVTGAPVLEEATVAFDCRVTQMSTIGTHDVMFCEVLGLHEGATGESLVYFGRRFHHLT